MQCPKSGPVRGVKNLGQLLVLYGCAVGALKLNVYLVTYPADGGRAVQDDSVMADAHSPDLPETFTHDDPRVLGRSVDHKLSSYLHAAIVTQPRELRYSLTGKRLRLAARSPGWAGGGRREWPAS